MNRTIQQPALLSLFEEMYARLVRFPADIVDRAANRDVRRLFVPGSTARQADAPPAHLFPSWARSCRGVADPLAGVLPLSGPDQPGPEHAIPGLHTVGQRHHLAVGWLFLAHLSGWGRCQKNGNWSNLSGCAPAGRRHRYSGLWS